MKSQVVLGVLASFFMVSIGQSAVETDTVGRKLISTKISLERSLFLNTKAQIADPEFVALEQKLLDSDGDYRSLREEWLNLVQKSELKLSDFLAVNNAVIAYYAHYRQDSANLNAITSFRNDLDRYRDLLIAGDISSEEFAWLVRGLLTNARRLF